MKGFVLFLILLSSKSFNSDIILCTSALTAEGSTYIIKLQNRQFVPKPGIDATLKEKLVTSQLFPVHGIVQLKQKPTTADRVALSSAGIRLKQYLGGTAYLAIFSKGSQLDETSNILRWAGLLLPQDKIERALWQGRIEDWARAKRGNIRVIVFFYKNVTKADSEQAISRFTNIYKPQGAINAWAIEIPQEHIRKLAANEIVKWIEQGPLPFMPLYK